MRLFALLTSVAVMAFGISPCFSQSDPPPAESETEEPSEPLDPVSEENGSLTIVPRSHDTPVRKHEAKEGINFGALAAHGIEDNPDYHDKAITLTIDPGECLLFNTRLFHRSGSNRTNRHRRVVTLHMASTTCEMTGPALSEYGFTLVRGRAHKGCLEPVESPSLKLVNELVE